MNDQPHTPLLDRISVAADLRRLNENRLPQLAGELRAEAIDGVSRTRGHLGAGLGVAELTVALHRVFDTPDDRPIRDGGQKACPHKILTGRRDSIRTPRQGNGLSASARRTESPYDPFGAAHSSPSIPAGLGMAVARDLKGGSNNVIAGIGGGAMSNGMALEAVNNAGALNARLIVVLDENDMSIVPPAGALSAYHRLRETAKRLARKLPKFLQEKARRFEEFARGFVILRDWRSAERVAYVKRVAVAEPGLGIGRRMVERVLDALFEGTASYRVHLGVFPDDLRARRCREAVGFVAEGISRGSAFFGGVHRNELVVAILRPERQARRGGA